MSHSGHCTTTKLTTQSPRLNEFKSEYEYAAKVERDEEKVPGAPKEED